MTLTVVLLLKTATGRTLLDDLSEIPTIEMEGEAQGVRSAAVGDGGAPAGLHATGNDTRLDESEMPRSFVLQTADPPFAVVAGCHALENECVGTRRHDPDTPEGVRLGLPAAPVTGETRGQILKFRELFLRQTPSWLPGYR